MARGGRRSRVGAQGRQAETPRLLVDAAIETLQEQGLAAASAWAIAGRAGCNQALVFYHFGSVANLLLAALDETSRRRMERYRAPVEAAGNLTELAGVAAEIYREDLDAGHITVLAQMIAAASSTPGKGPEVAARIAPWVDFTETTLRRVLGSTPIAQLVPARDLAFAIAAMYLGVEMISHLDQDRAQAEALLATATRLPGLLGMLTAPRSSATGPR
jgi:AcrR family transcriptional regulator